MSIKDYEAKFRPLETLTPRQLEVFEMLGTGKTRKEICSELGVSSKTVDRHVEIAREKTKCKGKSVFAFAAGWLVWKDLRHHIGLALFLVCLMAVASPPPLPPVTPSPHGPYDLSREIYTLVSNRWVWTPPLVPLPPMMLVWQSQPSTIYDIMESHDLLRWHSVCRVSDDSSEAFFRVIGHQYVVGTNGVLDLRWNLSTDPRIVSQIFTYGISGQFTNEVSIRSKSHLVISNLTIGQSYFIFVSGTDAQGNLTTPCDTLVAPASPNIVFLTTNPVPARLHD
jgi:DNA-binding CsgD family transcriptional regulator